MKVFGKECVGVLRLHNFIGECYRELREDSDKVRVRVVAVCTSRLNWHRRIVKNRENIEKERRVRKYQKVRKEKEGNEGLLTV